MLDENFAEGCFAELREKVPEEEYNEVFENFTFMGLERGGSMGVIKKRGARNVLVAVVRYFVGIKLGAGGLVRAYSKTAGSLFKYTGGIRFALCLFIILSNF